MNPLQRAAVRRKSFYLGAILALFTISIFYRGLEARTPDGGSYVWVPFGRDDRSSEAAPSATNRGGDWMSRQTIVSQSRRLELRELEQGDPEITGEAVRLGLVGSRGFAVTFLWYMALEHQKRNDFHKFEQLVKAVTTLQPHFITPWIFQSWNIAYNVSVEMHALGDMYFYIARGIDLLAEGERRNKRSPDMRYQLGFYYQNKFGVSDQVQTLRCLFQLSCIPPNERDPEALLKPDGSVDLTAFRQFCEKHPMLVRRLRGQDRQDRAKKYEGLQTSKPDDVVRFLRDNRSIPSRYKNATELHPAVRQFPALPPQFNEGPDEANPSMGYQERFSGYLAARAWFKYANAIVPPNPRDEAGNPIPSATPEPGEYDPFKYRIPRMPMLIIFRQGPPRAQSYQAEMMQKDGWFDAEGWDVDAGADARDAWFVEQAPAPGGGTRPQKPAVPVVLGSGTLWSQIEWQAAYASWAAHGFENAQQLRENQLKQLIEEYTRRLDESQRQRLLEAGSVPNVNYPGTPTADQKADPAYMRWHRSAAALFQYQANRSVTNFPFYLATSEAEQQPATIQARKTFWKADQARRLAENTKAIRLYEDALAQWKAVLLRNPNFHRTERLERIEEETFEFELDYLRLIAQSDDRVRTKAREIYAAEHARTARIVGGALGYALPSPTTIPDAIRDARLAEVAEKEFSFFNGLMPADLADHRAGTPWIRAEIREGVLIRQGIVKKPVPPAMTPPGTPPPPGPRPLGPMGGN